ncbi:MAG: thiamine phosphate synthase [Gaiellaceae bacterium]
MDLAPARLYFVTDPIPEARLEAALAGGVDVVQLRMKDAVDEEIVRAAALFRQACDRHGARFVLNDRPDLVHECGADGVHVGQEDPSAAEARALVGDRLVGLSTHSLEQLEAAQREPVDYVAVGPVFETPTKPGRAAVGLELVRAAAELDGLPWFAIGGIDLENAAEVVAAGAQRLAVVRAIRDADDPGAAARTLRSLLA